MILEKSSKLSNTQLFPLFVWNTVRGRSLVDPAPAGALRCWSRSPPSRRTIRSFTGPVVYLAARRDSCMSWLMKWRRSDFDLRRQEYSPVPQSNRCLPLALLSLDTGLDWSIQLESYTVKKHHCLTCSFVGRLLSALCARHSLRIRIS